MDLQGPLDTFEIVGVNPFGGLRIDSGQLGVQRRRTFEFCAFAQLRAERLVGGRTFKEPVHQAHQVERRAGDDESALAARLNIGDGPIGEFDVARNAERFARLGDVDQMMRDGGALRGRGLGRADVHAAIDLHRIDAENLGAESWGQLDRRGRLAGRRAAEQEDDRWLIYSVWRHPA